MQYASWQITWEAAAVPNMIFVASPRSSPSMVTWLPPLSGPLAGVTSVTAGTLSHCVGRPLTR